jgi:hypothetical protein
MIEDCLLFNTHGDASAHVDWCNLEASGSVKKHNIKHQVDVPMSIRILASYGVRFPNPALLGSSRGNGNGSLRIEMGSSPSGLEIKIGTGTAGASVPWAGYEKFGGL